MLRERGIYKTSDGARLVASSRRQGRGILRLFSMYAWAFHTSPEFIVSENGSIIDENKLLPLYHVNELTDTGHTAGAH
jgi:hypothetical protein